MSKYYISLILLLLYVVWDVKLPELRNDNKLQILDRHGFEIKDSKNVEDAYMLYQVPSKLLDAVIYVEDKHYFAHSGVNYYAKLKALINYFKPHTKVYGASTITEQVVRITHPRPKNIVNKIRQMMEAHLLEIQYSKDEILTFYINNVPYSANVIGVPNAAKYYFGRDLSTINGKEAIALAYILKSPQRLQKQMNTDSFDEVITSIAKNLDIESNEVVRRVNSQYTSNLYNYHYLNYLRKNGQLVHGAHTSLDLGIQKSLYVLLNKRLGHLKSHNVHNAAGVVIEAKTGDIVSYVSTGLDCEKTNLRSDGCYIDFVNTLRQAGSTLKPFVYAMALEKGWGENTVLNDTPYSEFAGNGTHEFHNYSHKFYGKIALKHALGNSLNIPAIHAINYVGIDTFHEKLNELGLKSLISNADFYGTGLVLGNGEITLLELARAYAVLARNGKDLHGNALLDASSVMVVNNILSDRNARTLEFASAHGMNIDASTAVKTGTSTGHRDAWAVAYDNKYVVAIWMGNHSREPMKELTGSNSAAPVLGQLFHIFRKSYTVKQFEKGELPHGTELEASLEVKIISPINNQKIAIDPRVPEAYQALELKIAENDGVENVEWYIDEVQSNSIWSLARGRHTAKAVVKMKNASEPRVLTTLYTVK